MATPKTQDCASPPISLHAARNTRNIIRVYIRIRSMRSEWRMLACMRDAHATRTQRGGLCKAACSYVSSSCVVAVLCVSCTRLNSHQSRMRASERDNTQEWTGVFGVCVIEHRAMTANHALCDAQKCISSRHWRHKHTPISIVTLVARGITSSRRLTNNKP